MKKALLALPLCALLGNDEAFAAGLRAYRAGRFAEALAAFTEAEARAGDAATPELLYDKALSALRAARFSEAESAAGAAAVRGGPEFTGLRDFLLGNVAFARCELAAAQASGPEAEPFAFDVALGQAERARLSWQRAALSRPDWPEARRNVERALLRLEELKQAREEARKRSEEQKKLEQPPEPPAPPPTEEEARAIEAQVAELSPREVQELLARLGAKEKEKLALRRARRNDQPIEVEKDW